MSAPLYTATATSTGEGRAGGRAVTDDGLLDLSLAIPASMGGPGGATNPEQLFAAGWASCFHSGLKMVAAQNKTSLTDSTVTAQVTLNKTAEGGLALSAELLVHVGGGMAQEAAEELVAAAHAVCPYSVATSGNVPVTLTTTVA
ncbi:Ohr family peroxiredoxin [Acidipropionibacterium virtanenii]|uniref:Organic hydroperoxide resistance protein OhrA n=1 Tax=Acidipropionibacterium virtanenii TaxID=2057246 RepID=A0A344UWU8_9ACTN|nr:Ohr family peroxiredoxin [Acidipropionibacterium virtanenii]AXE39746.1 Organic hydroperoxide resistance protein OhrA [Acidipropionibacterium virtanenii]